MKMTPIIQSSPLSSSGEKSRYNSTDRFSGIGRCWLTVGGVGRQPSLRYC